MNARNRFGRASIALCFVAGLCLVLWLSAAPRPPVRGNVAERQAAWLVGQLEAAEWHSSYAAWRAKHPTIPCRVFRGDGSALFIVNLWAYRCTRTAGAGRANDFFYILNPKPMPESYLDQFQGEIHQTPAMPISVIQKIHDQIESLLSERYGEPESLDSAPANVAAYGSGDWRLVRVWNQPDFAIYLYIRNTPGEPAVVGLLARDRALAQASTNEGTQLLIHTQPDAAFEDQIDNRLASDLEKAFPKISAVLSGNGEPPSTDNVLDVVMAALNSASSAPPDLRAELLLAADRLVTHVRLPDSPRLPSILQARLDGLKSAAGITFGWDELGDDWIYRRDLLWTVLQTAPQSEWGQDAFFLLLDHGWDTSGVCQKGANQFRTVIRQGEKFLQQFSASPARLPVTYLVGQAYETWWSLSQWSSCSPMTDLGLTACAPAAGSAQYRAGAERAREKAIAAYQSLLAADPDDYGTSAIRRSLARMELGIDTNQRRFYCLYN